MSSGAPFLVTGPHGFVGRALAAAFGARRIPWTGISRATGHDWRQSAPLRVVGSVRGVVHLSASVGVELGWENPEACYEGNVLPTLRVAEFCRLHKVPLVFLSSYVYGPPDSLPVSEAHPVRPGSPYARSKRLAEEVCEGYAADFGVPVAILRVFNLYGPGQPVNNLPARLLDQAAKGGPIRVRDLAPRRDYLHVADLARAIVLAAENPRPGCEVYNLGSGESRSVGEIAELVRKASGRDLPVETEGHAVRRNEIPDCYADTSKFRAAFGWAPEIGLAEGIARELAEWGADGDGHAR